MSEIAVISSRKSRLNTEARNGNKAARAALNLAEKPDKFLSTVQIGITLIGILTGIFSGQALAGDFGKILIKAGVPELVSFHIAQIIIIVVVTYISLVFGELVPKKIGLSISEKIAKAVATPMTVLSDIAKPVVWLLSKSSALIFQLLKIQPFTSKVTEEEINSLVREGTQEGAVQEVEQDIVERVFILGDRTVDSIMTHRNEIKWIDINSSNAEIKEFVQESPFYIYPVVNKNPDNVIGILNLKDMFGKLDDPEFNIRELIRRVSHFHEDMDVYQALEEMKSTKSQNALIYDEFGSFQGMITYKDILEALIGAIPDEPEKDPEIIKRENGGWLVKGQYSFYDFLEYFDMENVYLQNEYNTIAGLVLDKLGHIPKTGENFKWNKFTFEIMDMDGVRIDKVLVNINPSFQTS